MPAIVASAPAAASAGACPLVVAHRGLHNPYARGVPENSLASADAAFRAGAYGMETDVKFSKDGVPVIMHDDTVNSMTAYTGNVSSYTAAQLTSMKLRTTHNGSAYSSQTIPALAQLLAEVQRNRGHVIVEATDQDGHGLTAAEAQTFTATLERFPAWPAFATVASLDATNITALQQADPKVTGHTELMVIHGATLPDPVPQDTMEDIDGSYLTAADVQNIQAQGHEAGAWIIDDASGWKRFTRYGVDQITTDDVAGLLNWEQGGGCALPS